jgi:hypothetical protein
MLDRITPIIARTTKLSINKFQAFSILLPILEPLTIISEKIKYRGAIKRDAGIVVRIKIKVKSENCGSFLIKTIKIKPSPRRMKRPKKMEYSKVEATTCQKYFLIA